MFLTIRQIIKEYNINRDIIDNAIHSNELPAYQFGNKTKQIKRKDLERWIEQHKYNKVPLIKFNNIKGIL